jgi:pimeloyl-[acyl-carrier protein] synthase
MGSPSRPRLFGPGFYRDPYPTYAALREADQVPYDDALGAWVLTRYDDVAAALDDPRLSRQADTAADDARPGPAGEVRYRPLHAVLDNMMLFTDPPRHTRLRAPVHRALTPRLVASLRGRLDQAVDDLLSAVRSAGRMDVVRDLAAPLPLVAISELLGLPPADRPQFARWSQAILAFSAGVRTADQAQLALKSTLELGAYVRVAIARRRADPRDDLLSALVGSEPSDDALTEEEIVATAVLLLMNGHETVTKMIGNGLLALLRHPSALRDATDGLGDDTIAARAIEELLRFDGSVQLRGLTVKQDVAIADTALRCGERVFVVIAAANRDPRRFERPDTLDLARRENPHLEFGRGAHACIGAALARMQIRAALGALLARCRDLTLAVPVDSLRWQAVPVFRGVEALPVRFTPT